MKFILVLLIIVNAKFVLAQTTKDPFLTEKIDERLVTVKAISSSKKSFAVRLGKDNGIFIGQESAFSNGSVILKARAIEVNRLFSLWVPLEDKLRVPFDRDEFITYKNSVMLQEGVPQEEALAYSEPDLDGTETEEELNALKSEQRSVVKTKPRSRLADGLFNLRASFSYALSESTSGSATGINPTRSGINLEALYGRKWSPRLEWGLGIRYDFETTNQENPTLGLPTTRFFGIAELNYDFGRWGDSKNILFSGITFGYGQSSTEVDGATSSGSALLLPAFRTGIKLPLKRGRQLIFSFVFENISATESFDDTEAQTTNILNTKVSMGYRF